MPSRSIAVFAVLIAAAPAAAEPIAPPAGGCHYDIALLDAEARKLEIAMACEGEGPHRLSTYRTVTDAHVEDVHGSGGSTVARGGGWMLTGSGGVARAVYRFDVDGMAASTNSPAIGQRVGGSVVASVRSFLIVPDGGQRALPITLRFRTPAGAAAVTGLGRRGDLHRLATGDLPFIGYMAMGRLETFDIPLKGRDGAARLSVALLDGDRRLTTPEIARWIEASAARIGQYFGGFPVQRSLIVLEPVPGQRYLRRGMVAGGGGATMLLRFGADTEAGDLFGQWMLMHELVHFAAPFIEGHAWLMEGMAVYTETRLRVAAGWFPADQAWRGFLRNFRQGVPAMEQQGLATARGIGPIYWGGTLAMLLADAEIIEKSRGAKSLADCFKAVLDEGGDTTVAWTADRFIAVCDGATGFGTLRKLYEAHALTGTRLDLATLWGKLGVQLGEYETSVKYDDGAPLAWVRKRIMAAP